MTKPVKAEDIQKSLQWADEESCIEQCNPFLKIFAQALREAQAKIKELEAIIHEKDMALREISFCLEGFGDHINCEDVCSKAHIAVNLGINSAVYANRKIEAMEKVAEAAKNFSIHEGSIGCGCLICNGLVKALSELEALKKEAA